MDLIMNVDYKHGTAEAISVEDIDFLCPDCNVILAFKDLTSSQDLSKGKLIIVKVELICTKCEKEQFVMWSGKLKGV